ncbi:DUF2357 domain-containing protein [Oceanispirochaeta crateris]|uniref:DUF2357 domain-containing protein n=1 Tax=Oceanispirochaeta crateris TaxID=2518645 RepID=A0A5C1QJJ2_9SPIO|nr:DUF2357 domain-containing protein [Oceanispirochaeta crateris]QEN07329.1 DUF2357 domain-containing protein [Oceanispirochaeta crateris]
MPDILTFECEHWELIIWTRNNTAPRELLSEVLNERGKELPSEKVCLSFQLTGEENVVFEEQTLYVANNSTEINIPAPLCYENRDYEFEFNFYNGYKPDYMNPIVHRLNEIENGFRTVGQSVVRGVVNFKNNIGWFKLGLRYYKDSKAFRDSLSFKVFPTKMDMVSDLDTIGEVIDSTYPLWRFSLAQKTDFMLSRSNKSHESFELLWIAQFKSLANELTNAVNLICRSPHSRLLPDVKMVKAERITGRVTGRLEERIKENMIEKQYDKRYRIEKRKLSYDTAENRFVKMVLSYSVKRLKQFTTRVKVLEQIPENVRLSASFFDELHELVTPFEKLSAEPLFREIGNYDGRIRESLVLQQRTGYAKVYRIWQEMKLYLDYFGSDASVSVRSVEQLYEIWCLLEVRRLLMTLGFEEGKSSIQRLKIEGFEKNLKKTDETFYLQRPDGMKALLVHEPSYSGIKHRHFERIYSWTTTQRPDIFLEVTMPSGDKVRWVFDAKYRIDANKKKVWPRNGIDTVPDDAINQMHRYRDSLIYISEADEDSETDKSRPIIGAFALYPGWFENQTESENPYRDSIDTVGIGAFPLLPGQENLWLAEFLKSQLGKYLHTQYEHKEADELYLQESVRIAPYGMKQYRHSELILAADVFESKGRAYVKPFKDGNAQWYHIPESTVQNHKIPRHIMREIKYCAFTTIHDDVRQCRNVYLVEKVILKLRSEIDEFAGGAGNSGDSMYWLIKLGQSFQLPVTLISKEHHRRFRFRLVVFKDFLTAESWDDITMKYRKLTK